MHLMMQLSNDKSVPLVAFSLNKRVDKDGKQHTRSYDEFDIADRLRSRGWILPAYKMAPNAQYAPLLSQGHRCLAMLDRQCLRYDYVWPVSGVWLACCTHMVSMVAMHVASLPMC